MINNLKTLLLAGFVAAASCTCAETASDAVSIKKDGKKISVLFDGSGGGRCGHVMAGILDRDGFSVNSEPNPGLTGKQLAWDRVKTCNVLVLKGMGESNADGSLTQLNRENAGVIMKFLENGGGLLVIGHYGQRQTEKSPQELLLQQLGLQPLWLEMPVDPANSRVGTAWKIEFAHTDNITPSQITAGVKSLWYPAPGRRIGDQHHSITFTADKNWNIAVCGSSSSISSKSIIGSHTTTKTAEDKNTYERNVPLAAFREYGKGRVVFLGISHEYLQGVSASTVLEDIVCTRGLDGKPSDGLKLFENSLRYLAEPSAGIFGGAATDAKLLENPLKVKYCEAFDWGKEHVFPRAAYDMRGLIGARSTYSTGKATPEEWVGAAKKQDLKFIAFLEDFTKLTPGSFEQLKAECKKLSDSGFAAFAGFTIDDEIGNHYFYFANNLPLPDSELIDRDKKVFVSYDPQLDKKNPYVKGQLNMTVLNYFIGKCIKRLTGGNYLFGKDAAPFSDFFGNWNAMGVVTSNNGKLEDFAFEDYLKISNSGQGPTPLAITLLDSPEKIKDMKWHTVFKSKKQDTGELIKYFNDDNFYPNNPCDIYISSGPEIVNWSFVGPRDYEFANRGNFVWRNYRWKINGEVRSEAGLKEVRVYDGVKLFRKFLPSGAKSYSFTLDLTHDRQHYLVLEAIDLNGEIAISRDHWDRNHRAEEFMCADRNNQLTYSRTVNSRGLFVDAGGNQSLATPFKRVDSGEISPSGTFKNHSEMGAPAFDGGATGEPVFMWSEIRANAKDGKNYTAPDVAESRRLFHNGDVNIGECSKQHRFTDNIRVANTWHTLWKTEPSEYFDISVRNHYFQLDPDSPVAVFLKQLKISLKKDLPNNGFSIGMLQPRESGMFAIRTADRKFFSGTWPINPIAQKHTLDLVLNPGSYVAMLTSPLGSCALFPMSKGLSGSMSLPGKSNFYINLAADAAPQKAGESATADLLLIGIPRITPFTANLPEHTNEVVERFYRDFALGGDKPAYDLQIKSGKVLSNRYILNADGADANCFAATISGNLVSSLPITVSSLNSNWSAYYFDGGERKARPIGVFEDMAWVSVIVKGQEIFAGHPVTADNAKLFIQVSQAGENDWSVEIHNPTDADITSEIRLNGFFPPFKGKEGIGPLTVKGGSSIALLL